MINNISLLALTLVVSAALLCTTAGSSAAPSPCEDDWCLVGKDGGAATATEIRIPSTTLETYAAAKSRCEALGAAIASVSAAVINDILRARALPAATAGLAWSNAFFNETSSELQTTRSSGTAAGQQQDWYLPLVNGSRWEVLNRGTAITGISTFSLPLSGFTAPGCFVFNATLEWDLSVFPSCSATDSKAVAVCERPTSVLWTPLNDTTLEIGITSFSATAADAKAQCQRWGGTLAAIPSGSPAFGAYSGTTYLDFIASHAMALRPGHGTIDTSDIWIGWDAKDRAWDEPRTAANGIVVLLGPASALPSTGDAAQACTFFNTTLKTFETSDCGTTRRTVACTRYSRPLMRSAGAAWCTVAPAKSRAYLLWPPPLGPPSATHSSLMPNASQLYQHCDALWGGSSVTIFDRLDDITWCFADAAGGVESANARGNSSVMALLSSYDPSLEKDIAGGTVQTANLGDSLKNLSGSPLDRALVQNLTDGVAFNSSAVPQHWLPGLCMADISGSAAKMRFVPSPYSPSNWTAVPGGIINVTMLMGRPPTKSTDSWTLCFKPAAPLSIAAGSTTCQTFSESANSAAATSAGGVQEARNWLIKVDYAGSAALSTVQPTFECNPTTDCDGAGSFTAPKHAVSLPLEMQIKFFASGASDAAELSSDELQQHRQQATVGFPLWFEIATTEPGAGHDGNLFSADSDGYSGSDYDALVFSFSGSAGGATTACAVYDTSADGSATSDSNVPVTSSATAAWFNGAPKRFMLLCNSSTTSAGNVALAVECDREAMGYASAASRMLCRSFPNSTTVIDFAHGVTAAVAEAGGGGGGSLRWNVSHTDLGEPFSEPGVETGVLKYYAFAKSNSLTIKLDYPNISSRAQWLCLRMTLSEDWDRKVTCIAFVNSTETVIAAARRQAELIAANTTTTTAAEVSSTTTSTSTTVTTTTTPSSTTTDPNATTVSSTSEPSSSTTTTTVTETTTTPTQTPEAPVIFVPHPTREFIFDFSTTHPENGLQIPADGNVTVTLELFGPVAEQYEGGASGSSKKILRFTPYKIKVKMSGLADVIIFNPSAPDTSYTLVAANEYDVACAENAGCGRCDNRIRDDTSKLFGAGLPIKINDPFVINASITVVVKFVDAPAGADSVTHSFNPFFPCTDPNPFYEFDYLFNKSVEVRKPRQLNISGAPDTIYVGGPSRTMYLHTPDDFVVYGTETAPIVNMTVSASSASLSVSPSRVEWGESAARIPVEVSGLLQGAAQRIDFEILSPTTPQFLAPSPIYVTVLPRATVDLRLNNPQTSYVVGAEYVVSITVSRLPLDSDEALVVSLVQNSSYFTAETLHFYANSSGTSGDIKFRFTALPSLSDSLTAAEFSWLNLSLTGSAADAYYTPEGLVASSIRLGPVRRRIAVVVNCPAFALAGSTFDVYAELSRPPITSIAVHLSVVTQSAALTLAPTTSPTNPVVVLTWFAGESNSKKFNVTSNATFEGDTVLNFSSSCSGCLFKEVDDNITTSTTAEGAAPALLPENGNAIKVAITARSTAKFTLFGEHDLILDRVFCFNVSLSKPPPESGVLLVQLQGNGLGFVSVSPPQLAISGDALETTGTFCVNGTKVTAPGKRVNLTLQLLGAAADLYEPISAESSILLRVNPLLKLILDLPQALIIKAINRRNSSFALPEPLAEGVVFSLHLHAPGVFFEPSNFVIFGNEPDSNATRYFMMHTTSSGINVTVRGDIYGNATGFAPVRQQLELLPLGTVAVTADAEPIFRNEIAFLLIRMGRAPLENSALEATVITNCSVQEVLPWCVMSQSTVYFSRTKPTTVAIVIHLNPQFEDFPEDVRVPFTVVFNTSSTAAPQYSLVSSYPTSVHFVPRRRVFIVSAITTVFLDFTQSLMVNVSTLPDEGTTLFLQPSVSAGTTDGGAPATVNSSATSAVVSWNSTGGCCNNRLRVLPFTIRRRPDNGTLQVSFVLSSTPAVQQLRFVAPEPLTIRVLEKITLQLVSPPNPTQILGPANNQSFVVALNRPPSGWLRARFVYDAVFINMIRFTPNVLLWSESDTSETLNRTCTVIGEFLGVAEAIGFRLEASSIDEVVLGDAGQNLTAPLVPSLTVSGLRSVSFSGSLRNLVAGLNQVRHIYVTVSERPVKYPLVVAVNYTGLPGSLPCNASIVTFLPPRDEASSGIDGGRTKVIECLAVSPSLEAEFNVTVVDGPEYSRQVDGFVSFAVLQRPSLVVRKPDDTPAQLEEHMTVPSESNLTFALEIVSFEGAQKPSVDVRVQLVRQASQSFEFALARPAGTLSFTGASLRQFVSVAVVLRRLENFTATLKVDFMHDLAQSYTITLFVVESVRIVVPDFPSAITAGPWNGIQFHVNQTIVPGDERVVELRFDLAGCPATSVAVTSEPLRWSKQLSGAIAVGAVGTTPGTSCRLALRSAKSLAPPQQAPIYFEGSFGVLSQPSVAVGVNNTRMSKDKIKQALQVPFKGVQKDGFSVEFHALEGQFKFMAVTEAEKKQQEVAGAVTDAEGNTVQPEGAGGETVNASDHFMPFKFFARSIKDKDKPLPSSLEMGATPLYVFSSRTAEEAPRGIAALVATQCPNMIRVVPTSATDNANLPDGNVSNWGARLVLTPCTPLLLIEAESLTLAFGSRAFVGNLHPETKTRSLQLQIGRVSADLLSAGDWVSVQVPAVLGMFIGAFWFPALSLQPVRIASAVLSMDCPVTDVRFIEKQSDLPKVYFLFADSDVKAAPLSANGGWMAVAAINTALCILCFLLHLIFAVAGYFRGSGRVKRSFAEVAGKWHFPSASFHVIFFFAGSIIEASFRVIFLNANMSLTTGGIIMLIPPLVLVSVALHGVVWRNHSLAFHDITHLQENKWFLLRLVGRSGFWTHPDASYIARHASLFSTFRGPFRWFLLFEWGFTMFLSLLSAVEPTGLRGCQARSGTMAAVYFILLGAILIWRPYSILFHNITFAIYYLIMGCCVSTIASQMGDRIRDDSVEQSAIALAKTASAIQLIQSIIVLILEVVRWVFGDEETNAQLDAAGKDAAALEAAEMSILTGARNDGGGAAAGGATPGKLTNPLFGEGDLMDGDEDDDEDDTRRRVRYKRLSRRAVDDDGDPIGDDEHDKGADGALDEYLAGVERSKARGLFLTGELRGGETAFSPQRKKDLEEHRQAVRAAQRSVLPKRADPLKEEAELREKEEKEREAAERHLASLPAPSNIKPHENMMIMGKQMPQSQLPFDFFRQKRQGEDDDDDEEDEDKFIPGRRHKASRTKEISPEEFASM